MIKKMRNLARDYFPLFTLWSVAVGSLGSIFVGAYMLHPSAALIGVGLLVWIELTRNRDGHNETH